MFFITDHIPHLRTYAQWAEHEAKVKPIRGRTFKPIARRRDWGMHMTRGEDGSITLHDSTSELWATRVTYNPDDTVIIDNASPHSSTYRFIEAITGIQFQPIKGNPWLTLPGKDPVRAPTTTNAKRHIRMEPLHFRRVDGRWELLTEVEVPTYYKLDVKAWNALRKRIAPYMQQLEVFCKIRTDTYYERRYLWDPLQRKSTTTLINPQPAIPLTLVQSLREQVGDGDVSVRCMETEDLDQWVNLNVFMMEKCQRRYLTTSNNDSAQVVTPEDVINYALDTAKRERRDELFTSAPVTKPSHRRNENAKYFK